MAKTKEKNPAKDAEKPVENPVEKPKKELNPLKLDKPVKCPQDGCEALTKRAFKVKESKNLNLKKVYFYCENCKSSRIAIVRD
jgi:hypothetical protein